MGLISHAKVAQGGQSLNFDPIQEIGRSFLQNYGIAKYVDYLRYRGTAVFKWTLQEVPKIQFYWLLHTYFQRQGLTHEQMGKVYRAIDPHLRSSTSSNRIACRKVSRMIQNRHNHHNLVQYPNSKTACKNVPKQHVPGPKESHYSKCNVV